MACGRKLFNSPAGLVQALTGASCLTAEEQRLCEEGVWGVFDNVQCLVTASAPVEVLNTGKGDSSDLLNAPNCRALMALLLQLGYQVLMQYVSTRSAEPLWTLVKMSVGDACFGVFRKCIFCLVCLTILEVLAVQVRIFSSHSNVGPLMLRSVCGLWPCQVDNHRVSFVLRLNWSD